jgi:integrase
MAALGRKDVDIDTDRLWTADETARFLGIPKATLYQWHYLGIGPKPGRVGRHLRYDPGEVILWVPRAARGRMSISGRWHKTRPSPGDVPCREHSRGNTKLYPTAEHMRGDRWLVRWRDEQGNQCKRSFGKKSGRDPETSAEAFDSQRTADTARGDWIDPRIGRTPFGEYAPVWMKSRLHKTGTVDTYAGHLRNHIIPVLGKYGLAAIRPTMAQHWVKELQSVSGLSPATIETIYVIFASIMRGAVRDGYIRKTPCDDIGLPEVRPTVVRLLIPAQVLALADAMPRRYAPLVLLGAIAGLRQGEAFGLSFNRVDLDTEMITVDQQVVIVDRRPVLAPPKTSASLREVPMAAFLRDALVAHAGQLGLAHSDVLCRTSKGTLFRRDYYTVRSGSLPSWPSGSWPTSRSTTCATRLPVRPWPRASRSPRYPAGWGTSRSPPPSTSTATWSRRPAAGPAMRLTGRSPGGDVPPECPRYLLGGVPLQVRGLNRG